MSIVQRTDIRLQHSGMHYQEFLARIAAALKPETYLEIGTNTGASLAQFHCDAICIDPEFIIRESPLVDRRVSLFFQMTSDAFFAQHDARRFFPDGIDIAFLDGMHWFEFLLRDFAGVERLCHRRSLILIHDCLPANIRMAERAVYIDQSESAETRHWWTGDVWRIVPILKKYRPSLRVHLLNCPPTGLVAISNVEPSNTALRDNYYGIVDEFAEVPLEDFGIDKLWSLFPVIDAKPSLEDQALSSLFSLR